MAQKVWRPSDGKLYNGKYSIYCTKCGQVATLHNGRTFCCDRTYVDFPLGTEIVFPDEYKKSLNAEQGVIAYDESGYD